MRASLVFATASQALAMMLPHVDLLQVKARRNDEDFLQGTYAMSRPVNVVLWTIYTLMNEDWYKANLPDCRIEAAYGDDPVVQDQDYDLSSADVVVFNLAALHIKPVMPRLKREGQIWVATCAETRHWTGLLSATDCSYLDNPEIMSRMDAVSSYVPTSDFPLFYMPPSEEQMRREPPNFNKYFARQSLVSFVSRDCRAVARMQWVESMHAAFRARDRPDAIISYGRCLHNTDELTCNPADNEDAIQIKPSDDLDDTMYLEKANRCMARPFQLVAENSLDSWYVTEKVWNALATGTIPIYFGPREVLRLVPPNSIIFAQDFPSAFQLVDRLLNFTKDDYEEFRAWKKLPVEQWGLWKQARHQSHANVLGRICSTVSNMTRMPVVPRKSPQPALAFTSLAKATVAWPKIGKNSVLYGMGQVPDTVHMAQVGTQVRQRVDEDEEAFVH
jgi:hypothetical protein